MHAYGIQGAPRRGELAPASAPRMPAITEHARRQIETVHKCDTVLPRGTQKNKSRLNEGKESTRVRCTEPASHLAIRHTMTNSGRKQ